MKKKIKYNIRRVRYIVYRETLLDFKDHLITFIGAFAGIGLIGLLNRHLVSINDNLFLIGSFGATSVLVYGIPNSPLAQPRNLIGGHVLSALVGVTVYKLVPGEVWLPAALAVALSIVVMQITKTLHPPGGATAIIACIGSEKVKHLGYLYVLSPVFSGVLILLIIALIANNLGFDRKYPSKSFRFFRGNSRR